MKQVVTFIFALGSLFLSSCTTYFGVKYELLKPIEAEFPIVTSLEDVDRQGYCLMKFRVLEDNKVVNTGTACSDPYFCSAALATLEKIELGRARKGSFRVHGNSVRLGYTQALYDGETYEDIPHEKPFPAPSVCKVRYLANGQVR